MAVGLEDTVAGPAPASAPAAAPRSPEGSAPDVTLSERRGAPSPAATPRLGAGKQLGHFRIERLLGAGGMGEVYLATDLALDRPVAIKVLPEELAARTDRRERLVREARAQARVSHPHVAHIYFIGEDVGQLYFAMEYINGTTVADRIAKGPLPVDDAIAIIRAAITGLREANKHGVTHRDVKPSNLMIDANGIVKLVDFGLAAQREPTDD
ncbi:MAG: serine/threonine-protein kinase, partial [Kofleriaceae bacterium]